MVADYNAEKTLSGYFSLSVFSAVLENKKTSGGPGVFVK